MVHNAKTKAKGKAAHGKGEGSRGVAAAAGVDVKTAQKWIKEWTAKGFSKGFLGSVLDQKERSALETEAERLGISRARILEELAIVGFQDIRDFVRVDKDGKIAAIAFEKLKDKRATRALKKIRQKISTRREPGKEGATIEDQYLEFETHDKLGALEKMGRELGMFKTEADRLVEAGVFAFYREKLKEKKGQS